MTYLIDYLEFIHETECIGKIPHFKLAHLSLFEASLKENVLQFLTKRLSWISVSDHVEFKFVL